MGTRARKKRAVLDAIKKANRIPLPQFANMMRARPTKAELALKLALEATDLKDKFKFQHCFGGRILDFFFPRPGVCVEVDGGYHDTLRQRRRDDKRDATLKSHHVPTLRLKNDEVLDPKHVPVVIAKIRALLRATPDRKRMFRKMRDLRKLDRKCMIWKPPEVYLELAREQTAHLRAIVSGG